MKGQLVFCPLLHVTRAIAIMSKQRSHECTCYLDNYHYVVQEMHTAACRGTRKVTRADGSVDLSETCTLLYMIQMGTAGFCSECN